MLLAQRRRGVQAAARLDRPTLHAVAEVILPAEIGPAGRQAAVAGLERWLLGYRAGAELLHGYGSSEVRYLPPSPAPRFEGDLAMLDRAAQSGHGRPFAELSVDLRRGLIEAALAGAGGELPPVAEATHVAVGLLAHWTESSAGFDLAYQARINRFACRPLATSPARPARQGDGQ